MGICLLKGQPIQYPSQFMTLYGDYFLFGFRPQETILFQSFLPEAKAVTLPVKDLNDISLAVTETKEMARQRIKLKLFGNQNRQAVNRFAHVGYASGYIHLHNASTKEHHRLSRTASNLFKVPAEKLSPTAILNWLERIMCNPARFPELHCLSGSI